MTVVDTGAGVQVPCRGGCGRQVSSRGSHAQTCRFCRRQGIGGSSGGTKKRTPGEYEARIAAVMAAARRVDEIKAEAMALRDTYNQKRTELQHAFEEYRRLLQTAAAPPTERAQLPKPGGDDGRKLAAARLSVVAHEVAGE